MSVLDRIVDATRENVARRREAVPLAELEGRLAAPRDDRPFREALTRTGVSLIAEHKRRSPSAGEIRAGATVADVVSAYERGGAAALSILTEHDHFGGSLEDLAEARRASDIPILRKDFTIDPYQVYEARAHGADAVLLVVGSLELRELGMLHGIARELEMDAIVEVHDEEELNTALDIDADVIGINNRDLEDFSVDLQVTLDLLVDVPTGKTVVSESGIHTRSDVEELEQVGVDVERRLELLLVVDLDDRVHLELARNAVEHPQIADLERAHDEEHGVGAPGPGLVDLVRVDREVLAQDRDVGDAAGLREVVERAAEVERLGEDRQRGRAAALVGPDDLRDARALADGARGRRAALVLGDQGDARAGQGLLEGAALGARRDRLLQPGERHPLAPARDLVSGVVDDAIEDVHQMIGEAVIQRTVWRSWRSMRRAPWRRRRSRPPRRPWRPLRPGCPLRPRRTPPLPR